MLRLTDAGPLLTGRLSHLLFANGERQGFDTRRENMSYLVARLKEKSTYSGILALLSAVGVAVDPEQFSAIAAAVMALVGVFEVFRRESK